MAKKKEYSFADEAKRIMKRFPRRETDPIEKRDYEEAMTRLQQEQELARQELGLGEPQQMAGGGKMKYQNGGDYPPVINSMLNYNAIEDAFTRQQPLPYLSPSQLAGMGEPYNPTQQSVNQPANNANTARTSTNRIPTPALNESGVNRNPNERWMANEADLVANNISNSIPTRGLSGQTADQINQEEISKLLGNQTTASDNSGVTAGDGSFWDKNKQYAPYAISGAANMISNLLLANMAKKNQPRVSPAMATAERINLEPQAEALRKSAATAKNVAMGNARNLGVNAGSALANMGAIGAQVDRGLGQNLTNLYMQQEGANVGAQNRANLFNAQSQGRANMMNAQLGQQALQDRLGYTGAALGTIPGVMRDFRADQADQEMRNIMDKYYTNMGDNYENKGDSIWDDEAFQYMVANLPKDKREKLLKELKKKNA